MEFREVAAGYPVGGFSLPHCRNSRLTDSGIVLKDRRAWRETDEPIRVAEG